MEQKNVFNKKKLYGILNFKRKNIVKSLLREMKIKF
jgi:hypothetical protein